MRHTACPIAVDTDAGRRLTAVLTRLTAVLDDLQEGLINCGDAICDTGLRTHLRPGTARGSSPTRDDP